MRERKAMTESARTAWSNAVKHAVEIRIKQHTEAAGNQDACSVIIFLPLMPHRKHRYGFPVLDLEQGDIPGSAELDYQFTQKRVIRHCLAAGEGKIGQQVDAFADGDARPPRGFRVTFSQEILQAQQIVPGRAGEANPVAHSSSAASTSSAEK